MLTFELRQGNTDYPFTEVISSVGKIATIFHAGEDVLFYTDRLDFEELAEIQNYILTFQRSVVK